jgi:hypothetical protein
VTERRDCGRVAHESSVGWEEITARSSDDGCRKDSGASLTWLDLFRRWRNSSTTIENSRSRSRSSRRKSDERRDNGLQLAGVVARQQTDRDRGEEGDAENRENGNRDPLRRRLDKRC